MENTTPTIPPAEPTLTTPAAPTVVQPTGAAPAPAAVPAPAAAAQAPPQEPQQFLTGSALPQAAREPLPKGIYVIVALNVIGFLFGTSTTGQGGSAILSVGFSCLVMLATIGMLFRVEPARKTTFVLSVVATVTSCLVVGTLLLAQSAVDARAATAIQVTQQALVKNTNTSQRTLLQQQLNKIDKQQASYHRLNAIAISFNAVIAVVYIAEAVYLNRPQVKDAFEPLKQ